MSTCRRASESSVSPRLVEPARSQNTTVTTFRRPWGADVAGASAIPHAGQNRARSDASSPQLGHARTPWSLRRGVGFEPMAGEQLRVTEGNARGGSLEVERDLLVGPRGAGRGGKARGRPRDLAHSRPRLSRAGRGADDRGSRIGERHVRERRAHRCAADARPGRLREDGPDRPPGHRCDRAGCRSRPSSERTFPRPWPRSPPRSAEELVVDGRPGGRAAGSRSRTSS